MSKKKPTKVEEPPMTFNQAMKKIATTSKAKVEKAIEREKERKK